MQDRIRYSTSAALIGQTERTPAWPFRAGVCMRSSGREMGSLCWLECSHSPNGNLTPLIIDAHPLGRPDDLAHFLFPPHTRSGYLCSTTLWWLALSRIPYQFKQQIIIKFAISVPRIFAISLKSSKVHLSYQFSYLAHRGCHANGLKGW